MGRCSLLDGSLPASQEKLPGPEIQKVAEPPKMRQLERCGLDADRICDRDRH